MNDKVADLDLTQALVTGTNEINSPSTTARSALELVDNLAERVVTAISSYRSLPADQEIGDEQTRIYAEIRDLATKLAEAYKAVARKLQADPEADPIENDALRLAASYWETRAAAAAAESSIATRQRIVEMTLGGGDHAIPDVGEVPWQSQALPIAPPATRPSQKTAKTGGGLDPATAASGVSGPQPKTSTISLDLEETVSPEPTPDQSKSAALRRRIEHRLAKRGPDDPKSAISDKDSKR